MNPRAGAQPYSLIESFAFGCCRWGL